MFILVFSRISSINNFKKAAPITNYPWMRDALIQESFEVESIIESLTPLALQRDWRTPSEFPMCPEIIGDCPLHDYASRLESGMVFSRNRYGESIVELSELSKDGSCLSVLCKIDSGVKDWALSKVTFEDGKFIHTNNGSFFTHEGAEKYHCHLIGKPWTGPEETFDDYC